MGAPIGNQYAAGCTTNGRPLKFKSVEELETRIDEYLSDKGWKTKKVYSKKAGDVIDVDYFDPATITGLAVHLKTSRQTLINYEEKEEFFDTIKQAKAICEMHAEEGGLRGDLNPTMGIFSLKNNYGWKDKSESEVTGKDGTPLLSNLSVEFIKPKDE